MRVTHPHEIPERGIQRQSRQRQSQLISDDIASGTSASSIISDTFRDEILGKPSRRRRFPAASTPVSHTQNSSFYQTTKEEATSSWEIVSSGARKSASQQLLDTSQKSDSFQLVTHTGGGSGSLVIVERSGNSQNKNKTESFTFVPPPQTTRDQSTQKSSFVIVTHPDDSQKSESFEIVPPPQTTRDQSTQNSSFVIVTHPDDSQKSRSFEIVPPPQTTKDHSTQNSSFVIVTHPDDSQKSESFEIVPSPQSSREQKSSSFVIVSPEPSNKSAVKDQSVTFEEDFSLLGDQSMKKGENIQSIGQRTQTVGVQTGSFDSDCECDVKTPRTSKTCDCKPKCNCHNCLCGKSFSEDTSETALEHYTNSSVTDDTICKCKEHCPNYEAQSTTGSDDSEDTYSTDFFDLPYQNNEDYLKLLRELEKKLIARNRERVRKTMLEFEKRSRQNQNLEKPIFDYDDNASLLCRLGKMTSPQNYRKVCGKCGRHKRVNAVNSDIMQNEKRWEELDFGPMSDSNVNQNQNCARAIERSMHKSSWQLDPRSGEWIKVSCFQQTDYARHPALPHGDYLKNDHKSFNRPLHGAHANGCQCRQKKRR